MIRAMYKKINLDFFSQKLPMMILVIWMALIAALVWLRVCESQQPPIYDALSYLDKAKAFWDNVSQGWPQNPFNIGNPGRPPGTVLLSYPFGFSIDYRGYLFRSVIVPFVIWIIAILISAWSVCSDSKPKSYWPAVLAVFLLGPMPFFFQFEYPGPYWGLMDGFLASLAALAVACAGRSLLYKSYVWVLAAAAIAAFCPLVKPTGSIVLALTTAFWSGVTLLLIFRSDGQDRRTAVKFWLFGTIIFLVFGGAVSWICLHTQYLGTGVIAFFIQSQFIVRSEFGSALTYPIFQSALHSLLGPQIIIMVIIGGFLIYKRPNNFSFQPPNWMFIIASIIFLLVGVWFWIVAWGVSQLRYFYPFALMFMVPLVIIAFRKVYSSDAAISAFTLWGVRIACILPALNLLCLLSVQNPNDQWQRFSGVSIKISSSQSGVQIAKNLLSELTKTNKSAVVYMTNMNTESTSCYSYGFYKKTIHPSSPYFNAVTPIDWQRPSTYRINEILGADYILFQPISKEQQKRVLNLETITSFGEEEMVFEVFLSSLKPENGLLTVFENQSLRLSKITDESRFRDALKTFLKTKSWRPVFLEANETFFQDKKAFFQDIAGIKEIFFTNGNILTVGLQEKNGELHLLYCLENKHTDIKYTIFIHSLDSKRAILKNCDTPIRSRNSATKGKVIIPNDTMFLNIGLYIPPKNINEKLEAQKINKKSTLSKKGDSVEWNDCSFIFPVH